MATTRETILGALHALLQTQTAPVLRGEALPERVSPAGLLILRDGDPGEPAVTLSPLRYHHRLLLMAQSRPSRWKRRRNALQS